ncbi:MAG TPA: phosphatase PAP2 family protein [Caulobacteraceae bacterium]|nr:phosphatase PAP2 family protein [Caulobacteraceae bacterium]
MRVKIVLALVAAAALIACKPPAARTDAYLPADRAPDTIVILPPAPETGSARALADRAIFKTTRALEGTPRWALATADNADKIPDMERAFRCAAGVELNPQSAPRLTALMRRVARDVGAATTRPKDFYKHPRPYLVDEGDTCIAKTDALAKSPDYPSGHATWGWTWGLILAELNPGRQTQILARARAYGESRVVCGVHTASAVDAARTNAAALVAALHADAAFEGDLNAVRTEAARLRGTGASAPAACDAETALIAKTPW